MTEHQVKRSHPLAMLFIFWGEYAERFSFYGMRAILALYLTTVIGLSDAWASSVQSWFKTACYLFPLLGGFLADRYFGKYWTIVGFSVPYVLGHFILGIPSLVAVAIALILLAGGSGVIKPNIPTLLGQTYDQQRPGQEQLRSAAFLWYYFAVNVGATMSQILLPQLRDNWGYAAAFQVPAWVMVAALLAFAAGKRFYAKESIDRQPTSPEERRLQWQTLRPLLATFGLFVFFWIAYEQNDTIWIYFVRDYIDLRLPWETAPRAADSLQFINPLLVVIFVPLFSWLFRTLDPQNRIFTRTNRILAGFILTALASGSLAVGGYWAVGSQEKLSCFWYIVPFSFLSLGEILLYSTGLDLAYSMAPKRMKSFITSCFLLTSAIGSFINSGYVQLYGGSLISKPEERGPLAPGQFFGLTALLVVAAAVAFYFVGRQLDRMPRPVEAVE